MKRRTLLASSGAAVLMPMVGCTTASRQPMLYEGSGVPAWSATGAVFETFSDEHRVAGPTFALGGEPGIARGELNFPLVVVPVGDALWVLEKGNHRIQRFSFAGEAIDTIGVYGSNPGEFHAPSDMQMGPDGRVYVADTLNHRVQVFDAGGESVASFGEGELNGARAVSVLSSGEVHVGTHDGVVVFENGRAQGAYADGSVRALRVDALDRTLVLQPARGELLAYAGGTLEQRWRAEKAHALATRESGDVVVVERV